MMGNFENPTLQINSRTGKLGLRLFLDIPREKEGLATKDKLENEGKVVTAHILRSKMGLFGPSWRVKGVDGHAIDHSGFISTK